MKSKVKDKNFMEDSGTGIKRNMPDMPAKGRNPSAQKSTGFMEPSQKGGKRENPK